MCQGVAGGPGTSSSLVSSRVLHHVRYHRHLFLLQKAHQHLRVGGALSQQSFSYARANPLSCCWLTILVGTSLAVVADLTHFGSTHFQIISGGANGGGGIEEGCRPGRLLYRDGNFAYKCISTTPKGAPIYIFGPGRQYRLPRHCK